MRSSTLMDAGSMPEETLARDVVALDDCFLERPELSDFQRHVAGRLLRITRTLPQGFLEARAAIKPSTGLSSASLLVNINPRHVGSAEMTIYVERDSSVYIGVGRETTFGLPNDVWDERAKDVPKFTEQIVKAVMSGGLQETIHFRGDIRVRCESKLNVEGVPLLVDRTDLGQLVWGLLRRRSKQEVAYSQYG